MPNPFLGSRDTVSWNDSDLRPKNYRDTILYLYPNGDAPLTALLAKLKSERVDDPEFYWWTKALPQQAVALVVGNSVYTDSDLTTAYVSGGVGGDTLYVKMAEADIYQFRERHQVLFTDTSDPTNVVNAKVTAVTKAGASSYLTVKLLEADDNGASTDISDSDRLLIIGNVNPEGSTLPDAISYEEVKYYNKTQIFLTSVQATRTFMRTKKRTSDAWKEMKREALELHSIEMEKAFMHGVMSEVIGSNGHPERTTRGLVRFIKENGGVYSNYVTDDTDALWAGKTWLEGGAYWLDTKLAEKARYGKNKCMCFCGYQVITSIQNLIRAAGSTSFTLTPQTRSYGLQVIEWVTPFISVDFITHPLFSYEPSLTRRAVFFHPEDLIYRYIDDTQYITSMTDKNVGSAWIDGKHEGWLTEAGLEFHHPTKCMILDGFGQNNPA